MAQEMMAWNQREKVKIEGEEDWNHFFFFFPSSTDKKSECKVLWRKNLIYKEIDSNLTIHVARSENRNLNCCVASDKNADETKAAQKSFLVYSIFKVINRRVNVIDS